MSPIDVRLPGNQTNEVGMTVFMYWMKTREKHKWNGPFQKVYIDLSVGLVCCSLLMNSASLRIYLTCTCMPDLHVLSSRMMLTTA
jgi:hypothetical protein